MENAADALKIAFAVFVFVIAITTLFIVISQAKSTADIVTFTVDDSNYYDHYENPDSDNPGARIVDFDTVLATIYNCYTESIAVTIKVNNNEDEDIIFDTAKEAGEDWTSSREKYKEHIEDIIDDAIQSNKISLNNTFIETFDEEQYGGKYLSSGDYVLVTNEENPRDDGTTIQITPGLNKVYITYTLQ